MRRSGFRRFATPAIVAVVAVAIVGTLSACAPAAGGPWHLMPVGPPAFEPPGAPPFMLVHEEPLPEEASAPPGQDADPLVDPDLRLERAVTLADGSTTTCTVTVAAIANPSDPGGEESVQEARLLLASTDWDTALASSSDSAVLDQQLAAGGMTEAEARADELLRRIATNLFDQGVKTNFMGQTRCG
jgi:hypothetical protein